MKNVKSKVALVVLAGLSAVQAHAAIDVTDVTDALTEGGVAIATIGAAALVMIVGLKVWKRLRGAA